MREDDVSKQAGPRGRRAAWRMAWVSWRNRVLGNAAFQRWMTIVPFTRPVARARARQMFDLLAGFTYTQTLLATVESGLLDQLAQGPADLAAIRQTTNLSPDAALRLVRAAAALDLAEEVSQGWWMLGEQGAALSGNQGALAMIRHHRLLYKDLADPLALLRGDRQAPSALSRFWSYAGSAQGEEADPDAASAYSQLMAASQHLVAEQVLPAYDFSRHKRLLDVGGGHGAFLGAVANRHAHLELGLFDLPQVASSAAAQPHLRQHTARLAVYEGDFFADAIPAGFDLITLVRILHDHDDRQAQHLLASIRHSLVPGAHLLIAEPLARTASAKAMGDAYFGLYLWAMRSGRPRSFAEISAMLKSAGFASSRKISTRLPLAASIIVARA